MGKPDARTVGDCQHPEVAVSDDRALSAVWRQRDLGFDSFCLSRPLLEFTVQRAIEQQARISVRSHTRVVELVASPDGISVIGVLCETGQRQIETIEADLVVDASGRGGLTLALLEAVGHPMPDETLIGIEQGYSTAIFEIPDDAPTTW